MQRSRDLGERRQARRPRRGAATSALAALILAALAAGCQAHVPPHTIHVPTMTSAPPPPRSVAFFESALPLDGLRAAIDAALPAELTGKSDLGSSRDVEIAWHLTRQPTRLYADAAGLALEIALVGDLDLALGGGVLRCHGDGVGLALRAAARPALRPDGTLVLEHVTVQPEPRGTFACGPLPLPLATLVDELAAPLGRGLALGLEELRLPLGPVIAWALDALALPRAISLPPGSTPACLDLAPSALVLAPLGGRGDDLVLRAGVEVAPRLTLGACPAAAPAPAGPRPLLVRTLPLGDSFTLEAALAVPYDELNRRLAGTTLRMGTGRRAVTVERIALGDAGGHVLARALVSGALGGTLYLWGTPAVRQHEGRLTLEVPDLEVALETRSLLERLRLWLWRLVDGGLKALVQRTLVVDVTERVAAVRAALGGRYLLVAGSPSLTLTTTISDLTPGWASSLPGGLVAHPRLVGHATLTIGDAPADARERRR